MKAVKGMRLALVGPRQTWRVAGPQDMSNEEWEFSRKFGVTLIHIEMGEILYLADNIRDGDAEEVLKCLSKRTGAVKANGTTMQYMAKIYMATKEVIKKVFSGCNGSGVLPDVQRADESNLIVAGR